MSHHEVGPRGGGRMAVLYVHDWDVMSVGSGVRVGKKRINMKKLTFSNM